MVRSAVARSPQRQKKVYDPLTLWKKLPGRNDRREDTISVAGRRPDSRFARARSNRKVNRRLCLTPPNVCSTVRSPTPRGRISRSWTASMRLSCRGPFSSPPSPSVKANGAARHSTRVAREIPNRRMQGLTRFGISGIRIADCAGAQIGVQPEAPALPRAPCGSASRRRSDAGGISQKARAASVVRVEVRARRTAARCHRIP